MLLGLTLTKQEIGQIVAYTNKGLGFRTIAKRIGRSRCVVRNVLKNPDTYGTAKRSDRVKKLTASEHRNVLRTASNSDKSLAQIKAELALEISRPAIWRAIKSSPFIVRSKKQKAPNLTDLHKRNRLEFARDSEAF